VHAVRVTLAFNESAQELLARSLRLRMQAYPEYQDDLLVSLEPNLYNGSYYRLEELLADAVVLEEPTLDQGDDASGIMVRFDFEGADTVGLESAMGRIEPTLAKSTLLLRSDSTAANLRSADFLTNTKPLLIPKDEVGSIVIRARTGQDARMMLAWSTIDDRTDAWKRDALDIYLIADSSFHTYEIDAKHALQEDSEGGQDIKRLFIWLFSSLGAAVEIDVVAYAG